MLDGCLPVCINGIDITIRQLDVVATHVDSDFREPISRKVRGAPITLVGQINLGDKTFEALDRNRTGDEQRTVGHVLFRKCDLDDAGVAIKKGDQVVALGSQATDLLIDEVRPESPLNGDFLLIYCEMVRNENRGGIT